MADSIFYIAEGEPRKQVMGEANELTARKQSANNVYCVGNPKAGKGDMTDVDGITP